MCENNLIDKIIIKNCRGTAAGRKEAFPEVISTVRIGTAKKDAWLYGVLRGRVRTAGMEITSN